MDLEQFRARTPDERPVAPKPKRRPRPKPGEWYLRGPIPGAWLTQAACLSWRALRVGLALWHLAGLGKCKSVKPTRKAWERFGLASESGRLGLLALERAGLVAVDRQHAGSYPVVTLLEVKGEGTNGLAKHD
jgi:hypothetical protein